MTKQTTIKEIEADIRTADNKVLHLRGVHTVGSDTVHFPIAQGVTLKPTGLVQLRDYIDEVLMGMGRWPNGTVR